MTRFQFRRLKGNKDSKLVKDNFGGEKNSEEDILLERGEHNLS